VVLDWPGVPRIILTPNLMEFQRLCLTMVCHSHHLLLEAS
jgi:ATP-dependent NAD(P)H-hydrate dehydratase